MAVYKRTDWNGLINDVNNVLANPPDGCDPIDPIPEVGVKHRWSKDDIQEVHDKLIATCSTISFSGIPELWKQSIIDEINSALESAWCDCDDDSDDCGDMTDEGGTEIDLLTQINGYVILGCDTNPAMLLPLSEMINGMSIGRPGIVGRTWRLYRRIEGSGSGSYQNLEGSVACDGTIVYGGTQTISTHNLLFGFCSNCSPDNTACNDLRNNLQQLSDDAPPRTYLVRLLAQGSKVSCNPNCE